MDSEVDSQAVNMVPEAREDGEVPSSRWSSLRRSLRTRRRQIAFAGLLLEHYAALYSQKYNLPAKRLSAALIDRLTNWSWPGNVRALRQSATADNADAQAIVCAQNSIGAGGGRNDRSRGC